MLELRILRGLWRGATLLTSVLVLFVSGCVTTPALARGSAARFKVRGYEVILIKDGRTHYFENLFPHCLAYTLPGDWDFAIQERALSDRHHFVGVLLLPSEAMPGEPGADPVSQAVAYFQAETEKDWGRSIPSTIEPFPAARAGAVLLQFGQVTMRPEDVARALGPKKLKKKLKVGQTVKIEQRVILPLLPGWVLVVTAGDVTDARQVLDTLEVTEDPRCWEPTIRERFPGVLR